MTNIEFQRGTIDAGGCVSGGWELIKPNYWMYFGMTILLFGVSLVVSCIPFLPILFQIFVVPAVTIGIFYTLFREMRGEPVEFGMMFKGFEKYVPAMVIGLINAIPQIILTVLSFAMNMGSIVAQILQQAGRGSRSNLAMQTDAAPVIAGGLILVIVVGSIVFLLFSIAWGITFFFALPILAENDISAVDAIKLSASAGWSNIGGIIVLFIFEGLIALLGLIALCIGVFFVIPILFAANAFAYRQVFPLLVRQNFNMSPPPPAAYGSNFGSGM